MIRFIVAYVAAAVVFLALDTTWLATMGKLLYRPLIGDILADTVKAAPAVAFYVIYIGGIVYFAVAPAFDAGRWNVALTRGAALGLVAYATYDFTNMATLKNWPAIITAADLGWGMVATAVAATLSYLIAVTLA